MYWAVLVTSGEAVAQRKFGDFQHFCTVEALADAGVFWQADLERADLILSKGDESLFRAYSSERYAVECVIDDGGYYMGPPVIHYRPHTEPLFITPQGLLDQYPTLDRHLFVDIRTAHLASLQFAKTHHWVTRSTTLAAELKSSRYKKSLVGV